MEKKTIELEQRHGLLWFAVYSYSAQGNKTLLECLPSFELASQRFPEATLNGISRPDVMSSQDLPKHTS